jgi:hypothetical protein
MIAGIFLGLLVTAILVAGLIIWLYIRMAQPARMDVDDDDNPFSDIEMPPVSTERNEP